MKYEVSKESYIEGLEDKPEPEIIVIDIEKAEKISKNNKLKSKTAALKNKLKSFTLFSKHRSKKSELGYEIEKENRDKTIKEDKNRKKIESSYIFRGEDSNTLQDKERNVMSSSTLHSSQNPVSKPPLTKGRTVSSIVKRLSTETSTSPPPKPNVMKIPDTYIQHNNNQPFSYTNKIKEISSAEPNQVIYAQVICPNGNSGSSKYTVHTSYNQNYSTKQLSSDSDEGLGRDEIHGQKYGYNSLLNSDRMGSKTKEISARRDLLESRINQRLMESSKILRDKDAPIENRAVIRPELNTNYTNRYLNKNLKQNINNKNYSSLTDLTKRDTGKDLNNKNTQLYYTEKHKIQKHKYQPSSTLRTNSLPRKSLEKRTDNRKLVDSGIENDIFYESSEIKHLDSDDVDGSTVNRYYAYKNSYYEDVEYAEPIVEQEIKKQIEFESKTLPIKRHSRSHYNKSNVDTMKYKTESSSMPQLNQDLRKNDKKKGLEKVKGLFRRDKKNNENKHGLAREESLKARYKEYNGSHNNKDVISSKTMKTKQEDRKHRSLRFFGDSDSDKNEGILKTSSRLKQNGKLSKSRERLNERNGKHESSTLRKNAYISNSSKKMNGVQRTPSSSPVFRKNYKISSPRGSDFNPGESSTEGENSQPSQRSVVYLHAATVGDIPSPRSLRRRAYSREELAQNQKNSRKLQPEIKTLSRSFSMLAPWRPRGHKNNADIDYSPKTLPKGDKYRIKSMKKSTRNERNSEDSAYDSKEKTQSRENLTFRKKLPNDYSDSYYKKNNNRYSHMRYPREEKSVKLSASRSMESLRDPRQKMSSQKVGRSKSIPKNTTKPRFM